MADKISCDCQTGQLRCTDFFHCRPRQRNQWIACQSRDNGSGDGSDANCFAHASTVIAAITTIHEPANQPFVWFSKPYHQPDAANDPTARRTGYIIGCVMWWIKYCRSSCRGHAVQTSALCVSSRTLLKNAGVFRSYYFPVKKGRPRLPALPGYRKCEHLYKRIFLKTYLFFGTTESPGHGEAQV